MISHVQNEARFQDRRDAGRALAQRLGEYANREDVIVLGLPPGGVPVAFEVAKALRVPMDVFIVRKLAVPGYEELAMGAIASGGVRVLNQSVLAQFEDTDEALEAVTEIEMQELQRCEELYREGRPLPELRGRAVILVDDGLATGATIRAAVMALREHGVARRVVAVPVSSPRARGEFSADADDIVSVVTPWNLQAIGQYYDDFSQTTDEEVRQLLTDAASRSAR